MNPSYLEREVSVPVLRLKGVQHLSNASNKPIQLAEKRNQWLFHSRNRDPQFPRSAIRVDNMK